MIKLIPFSILDESSDDLHLIYINSFPFDERRDWKEFKELVRNSNFTLNKVLLDQQLIGLISLWKLPDFVFIEHFAIEESFQDKGIGSQVIKQIVEKESKKVVLEVDEPTTELTKRRIIFYERLGFSVCKGIYWQPPYSVDKQKVKMLLMSYPDQLQPVEFDEIKRQIYRDIYLLIDSPNY